MSSLLDSVCCLDQIMVGIYVRRLGESPDHTSFMPETAKLAALTSQADSRKMQFNDHEHRVWQLRA